MKTIWIHNSITNSIWHQNITLNLAHFWVNWYLSTSVDTKFSTFTNPIMISLLHSEELQIPKLKFSHNFCIWIYQFPSISLFFHPLIKAFTQQFRLLSLHFQISRAYCKFNYPVPITCPLTHLLFSWLNFLHHLSLVECWYEWTCWENP